MRIEQLLIAVMAFAVSAAAHAQTPMTLERAADVKGLVKELKGKAAADTTPISSKGITDIYTETSCGKVTFNENSTAVSDPMTLLSRTWIQECDNINLPGGGGWCVPRPRRLVGMDEKTVQVELKGRVAPGPKEVFDVCLRGQYLTLRTVSSPHKYNVARNDGYYTLTRK